MSVISILKYGTKVQFLMLYHSKKVHENRTVNKLFIGVIPFEMGHTVGITNSRTAFLHGMDIIISDAFVSNFKLNFSDAKLIKN